ncbi:MAG TPA: hypothetical protein VGD59_01625 [Acidisarcina sp.]
MQAKVNTWVWALGVAMQSTLLMALIVRRLPRRIPVFTLLIAFYLVRSAVLFGSSGHVSRAALAAIYNGLSLADLMLQIAVAAEIAVLAMRQRGGLTLGRSGALLGLLAVAASIGWAAGLRWQTRGRVSLDRGQIALAVLFVLLFVWGSAVGASGLVRRQMEGFALYSGISLASQVERYQAAVHRDAGMYIGWSYTVAAVYLVVLGYWLLTLRDPEAAKGNSATRPGAIARA